MAASSSSNSFNRGPIKCVAIVGGTHGNEANGVALARHLIRHPDEAKRSTFETKVMLSNHEAIAKNVRYCEEDMNRCFFCKDLVAASLQTKEAKRAKEINMILGPKKSSSPVADLIIDLHNTTANTGVALMMSPKDELSHAIGSYLASKDDTVRVVNWTAGKEDYPMLPTIGRHGMTFEVGGVPWGCVDAAQFQQSLTLLMHLLDYVDAHNKALDAADSDAWKKVLLPTYDAMRTLDYPRYDDGTLAAACHPHVQNNDFIPLKKGDPVFLTMEGESIGFEPTEADANVTCFPFFVNEAAYYEKGIAMMIGHRNEQPVNVLVSVESGEQIVKRQKRS